MEAPVNNSALEAAFKKVLNKPFEVKPLIPSFLLKIIAPISSLNSNMKDMIEMMKWVNTGVYVSKDTERQKKLFGDLPLCATTFTSFRRVRNLSWQSTPNGQKLQWWVNNI